jgi:3-methyladenine DNA glycosylase AlkD
MMIDEIKSILENSEKAPLDKATMFFKIGPGHYAAHDRFLGIAVPNLRKIAKTYSNLATNDIALLLQSEINEERSLALFILVMQYQKALGQNRDELYQFYLNNLVHVNNWNLVDASAYHIIGAHLWDKDRSILLGLAKSAVMWERRIAIVSTLGFIRKNDLEWTFKIAAILLDDSHDLIHKAAGWMLREAGKKDQVALKAFLDQHLKNIPRTMLRYAIEKFPADERNGYRKA